MRAGQGPGSACNMVTPSLLAFPVGCSGSPPLPPTIPCEAMTMPGVSPPPIGFPLPPPLRVRARPGLFHISVPGLQAPAIVSDLMAPSPTSAGAGAPWAAAHRRRGSPGAGGHRGGPVGPAPALEGRGGGAVAQDPGTLSQHANHPLRAPEVRRVGLWRRGALFTDVAPTSPPVPTHTLNLPPHPPLPN